MEKFKILSEPKKIYKEMLEDISSAKECIFLETYIYDNDSIGKKFREALIKKAEQGVVIKVLIDALGSSTKKSFFKDLKSCGAEIRFFREFKYVFRIFTKNHERNHRKLLIIDDKIFYIGSINITETCLSWRELVLRFEGEITPLFTKSFMKSWDSYEDMIPKKIKSFFHKGFTILNDIPSTIIRLTEEKYVQLINQSQYKIRIETPYFVPSKKILNAFYRAVKRGVEVILILPLSSDVKIVDIIRNRYLGKLSEKGIKIKLYNKKLHSKLLIVDNDFFMLGSSNLDCRSLIYQYEINLLGEDKRIIKALIKYFNETLSDCESFIYEEWKKRSYFKRFLEHLISYIENFL
jgi:cardiolipin synthase